MKMLNSARARKVSIILGARGGDIVRFKQDSIAARALWKLNRGIENEGTDTVSRRL